MVLLIVAAGAWLSLAMAGAWFVQWRTANSGWVDAVWSLATGLAGVLLALWPIDGPPGMRQWLVALLVAAWSLRLGLYIVARTGGAPEDPRYAQFRIDWGAAFQRTLFRFLQIQALAGLVLALAVMLAARNPADGPRLLDLLGALVLLVALYGEAQSDSQLRRFRADPANRGRVCDTGLWAWSRHPNYFFEWLAWLAIPLFAINLDGTYLWGWLALAAPAFMYFILVHGSGIPPLEAHMLKSRGDAYRAYQARVSPFFPLPPRRA